MRDGKGVVSGMETPTELTVIAAAIFLVTIVAAAVVAPSVTQEAMPAASTFNFNPSGLTITAPVTPEVPRDTPLPVGAVIVQYKSGVVSLPTASAAITAANVQAGATLVQTSTVMPGLTLVKLPAGASVDAAIATYKSNPAVENAWPNDLLTLQIMPNDQDFAVQWGLHNTGQLINNVTGIPGDDINVTGAWNTTTGSSSIIVAVGDCGVQTDHPDLAANIGPGFNFADNTTNPDPYPQEESWHGTHVAGIIGAVTNNSVGVAGVSPNVTIMPLQLSSPTFSTACTNTYSAVEAIKWAEAHNASIINFSWGCDNNNSLLYETIKESPLLFVCAAGNNLPNGTNNDQAPFYPSSWSDLPNVISVAASDSNGNLAYFSNYGRSSVDLAAPGVAIRSTVYMNGQGDKGYGYLDADGTSMAAPFVSGVAALVKAAHPSYGAAELKSAILNSTDPKPAFADKTVTGGMLDAGKAVLYNVSGGGPSSVTPSAGDLSGRLTAYEEQTGLTVVTPFVQKQDDGFTYYYGVFENTSQGTHIETDFYLTNSSASTAQVTQAWVQILEIHGFSQLQSNDTVWIGKDTQNYVAEIYTGAGAFASVAGAPGVEISVYYPISASQQGSALQVYPTWLSQGAGI